MKELKTFEDLLLTCDTSGGAVDYRDYMGERIGCPDKIVDYDKARKEVIKWIKDMEAEQPYKQSTWAVIQWVKIFFNIKEGEVK